MSAPLIAPPPRRSRRRDRRYRIAREYCGAARPQHVARFCDDWIGFAPNRAAARDIVVAHRAARDAIICGERKEWRDWADPQTRYFANTAGIDCLDT